MGDGEWQGWKTMRDGSRVPMKPGEAEALILHVEAEEAKRKSDYPTEKDARREMFRAWLRLKDFGWREAEYCPKDGSPFDVIEADSSGVHRCHYSGEWPRGQYWISSEGDLWPSRPILFRLDPAAEEARKAKMAAAAEKFARTRRTFNDD